MTVYDYIGLYFFSAVFQGNMALLALLGVFVVYKQQMVSTELHEKENQIFNFVRNYFYNNIAQNRPTLQPYDILASYSFGGVEDVQTLIQNMIDGRGFGGWIKPLAEQFQKGTDYKKRLDEINIIHKKRKNIVNQLKRPLISFLIVIILSLALLPLIPLIHEKSNYLEIPLIACTFILNVWVLVETTLFVRKMLKD